MLDKVPGLQQAILCTKSTSHSYFDWPSMLQVPKDDRHACAKDIKLDVLGHGFLVE